MITKIVLEGPVFSRKSLQAIVSILGYDTELEFNNIPKDPNRLIITIRKRSGSDSLVATITGA